MLPFLPHRALGCSALHGHWSRAGVTGKPQLPPSAGSDRANPGCARLGWDCSLFLEALETSRDGTAFFFPFIHRRGHFDLLHDCAWFFYCCCCLLCPAFYSWHQRSRTGRQQKQRGSFGVACLREQKQPGCKHSGDMSVSAMKCLFFVSCQWHSPDPGMQREGEEPAGFHLGHSLVPGCLLGMLWKLQLSKKLGSRLSAQKRTSLPQAGDIRLLIPFATSSKVSQP